MRFLLATWATLLLLCTASLGAPAAPNIVLILADDMGYGDVHALNPASRIPTPNLDQLAAEGMAFTDAHTPSAVCTPTRYGLLTGRYAWRSSLKSGVLNGYSPPLIEKTRPTVASFLQSQGYTTGVVGKWHLGLGFQRLAGPQEFDFTKPVTDGPNDHGFDQSHVIPASLDFPPYVYVRNGALTQRPTLVQQAQEFPAFVRKGERSPDFILENCLDDLLKQAVGFITTQSGSGKPFFLYFPLTAPHKPVLPHPRFRGKTALGPYGDLVAQVDWTVGEVLKALSKNKLQEKTIVIFTSDNGSYMYRLEDGSSPDHVQDPSIQGFQAVNHTSNFQFRGTKADIWEAGHRVPFLVRWPGRVKAGSRSSETICLTDIFATAAEILGTDLPDGAAPDSFSIVPLLEGRERENPRPPVIHHSSAGMFAIRDGQWKLVLGNGSGGREAPKGKPFEEPFQLFDLSKDISEKLNLIDKETGVASRLSEACDQLRGEDSRQ